jgi:hypothetical protein
MRDYFCMGKYVYIKYLIQQGRSQPLNPETTSSIAISSTSLDHFPVNCKMARPAPPPDPLRPRASRIEKRRATKKTFSALPDWYHRILEIRDGEDRPPEPPDFDEDLSELSEEDESDEPAECECGSDDECDCDPKGKDDADKESERSYDGSEASYYYEVKEQREERKIVLRELHERDELLKELEIRTEEPKAFEARCSYKAFEMFEKSPMASLDGQEFRLFSVDHVDRYHCFNYPTKRLAFTTEPDKPLDDLEVDKNGNKAMYGELYIDSRARCDFGPLRLPTGTSREINVVCDELDEYDDDEYDLRFEFAGYGNEYVKVSVSSNLVARNEHGNSENLPETFEFYGILRGLEKEKESESPESSLSSSLDDSDEGTP